MKRYLLGGAVLAAALGAWAPSPARALPVTVTCTYVHVGADAVHTGLNNMCVPTPLCALPCVSVPEPKPIQLLAHH